MPITNVTELIWSRELEMLLRMCGEPECFIDDTASDYQRFFAFCRSAKLLRSNRIARRISNFLETLLMHPVDLCEDNAQSLWKESAVRILATDLSKAHWECFVDLKEENDCLDVCPRCARSDFFDGNSLLNTSQNAWEPWRAEMETACGAFFQKGLSGACLVLPNGFVFQSPHPYGVGLALQHRCEEGEENLLLAQAFRFLSEACQKKDKTLLCRIECDAEEAIKLFSYTERQVGLSPMLLCLAPSCDLQKAIVFCGISHPNAVGCALQKQDYPTEADFFAALRRYAALYPLGKLRILE